MIPIDCLYFSKKPDNNLPKNKGFDIRSLTVLSTAFLNLTFYGPGGTNVTYERIVLAWDPTRS